MVLHSLCALDTTYLFFFPFLFGRRSLRCIVRCNNLVFLVIAVREQCEWTLNEKELRNYRIKYAQKKTANKQHKPNERRRKKKYGRKQKRRGRNLLFQPRREKSCKHYISTNINIIHKTNVAYGLQLFTSISFIS